MSSEPRTDPDESNDWVDCEMCGGCIACEDAVWYDKWPFCSKDCLIEWMTKELDSIRRQVANVEREIMKETPEPPPFCTDVWVQEPGRDATVRLGQKSLPSIFRNMSEFYL